MVQCKSNCSSHSLVFVVAIVVLKAAIQQGLTCFIAVVVAAEVVVVVLKTIILSHED